ncbi:MAG: hypothetical protein Q9220_002744 [cf. Caloplaca sp. 1 TL-2023]
MHIRERLRAAFLQKQASQICWQCVLSGRRQSYRSIQSEAKRRRASPKAIEVPVTDEPRAVGFSKIILKQPTIADDVINSSLDANGEWLFVRKVRIHETKNALDGWITQDERKARVSSSRASKIEEQPAVSDDVSTPLDPHENASLVRQVSVHSTQNSPGGWITRDEKRARVSSAHENLELVRQVRIHGTQNAPGGWINQDEKGARMLSSRAAKIEEQPTIADDVSNSLNPQENGPLVRQVYIHGTQNAPGGWITQDEWRSRVLERLAAKRKRVSLANSPNDPEHTNVDPQRPYRLRTRYPPKPKIHLVESKRRQVFRYTGGARVDNGTQRPNDDLLEETEDLLKRWEEGPKPHRHKQSLRTIAPSRSAPLIKYHLSSFEDTAYTQEEDFDQSTSAVASSSDSMNDHDHIQAREVDQERDVDRPPLNNTVLWSPRESNAHLNSHKSSPERHPWLAGARKLTTGLEMQELRPRLPTENLWGSVARLHTSAAPLQNLSTSSTDPESCSHLPAIQDVGIHEHLKLWQQQQDSEKPEHFSQSSEPLGDPITSRNSISQSADDDSGKLSDDTQYDESDGMDLVAASVVDQEGETDDHHFLRPGDVVDYSTSSDSMLAVFIQNIGIQAQFYTMQGTWFQKSSRRVMFSIPGFFAPDELIPLIPYLPDKEIDEAALDQLQVMDVNVPREVGAHLISKLQACYRASAEVYREHLERFDRAHPLLAEKSSRRMLSLSEVARIILQKQSEEELTDIMLWTVHKRLVKDQKFRPLSARFHRTHPVWIVSTTDHIHDFEQVQRWLREYLEGLIAQATSSQGSSDEPHELDISELNPTPRFIEKARGIIQRSRLNRKVTAHYGIGPSSQHFREDRNLVHVSCLTKFDPREKMIIDYLADMCVTFTIPNRGGGTWSLGSMLLRSTGMYEGHELNLLAGSLFLRELGVIAPWESRKWYDPQIRLPSGHDAETKQLCDRVQASVCAMHDAGKEPEDSLKGIRRDWGDMPVYCIDSASAMVIDDGISLEKVEGQDSVYWVHTHVANPSAFIGPDSIAGRYAQTLFETLYLPEKVFPMLNSQLSQQHFSLANDRPVLTFSAKLAEDGSILDTQVTPGWIHNVKRLTHDTVDGVLGFQHDASLHNSTVLSVGQQVKQEPTAPSETPLSLEEKSELMILRELGSARRSKRGSDGATLHKGYDQIVNDPYVYTNPKGLGQTFSLDHAREFHGDPFISWEARDADETSALGTDSTVVFVGEIMLLTGEVAGLWCSERNIPIPYRGTVLNPSESQTAEEYRAEFITPALEAEKYIPAMHFQKYNHKLGQSALRSHPFPHAIIGSKTYAKVTSPLRRYPDMLIHWQVQAALLHEARHGPDSLISETTRPSDDGYLPFSRAAIDALLPGFETRERAMNDVARETKSHWIIQLIHRAFHHNEDKLPDIFDVLVDTGPQRRNVKGAAIGTIKQLSGIVGNLLVEGEAVKKAGGLQVEDWWKCRIAYVDNLAAKIFMEPVSLVSRDLEKGGWSAVGASAKGGN